MNMPLPPKTDIKIGELLEVTPEPEEKKGELTRDEAEFILDSTLSRKDRGDQSVIQFINSFVRCKSIKQSCEENGLAYSLGYSIRNRKSVANCISKIIALSATKYGYDASEIFERAKEIAEFDPIDLMNPDGTYKESLHDIPPEARRCIKKLEVKNLWGVSEDLNGVETKIIVGKAIKYEFWDKMKGIELAGKEKEMFKSTVKVQHDLTDNMADVLLASQKRAEKAIENLNKEQPLIIEAEVTEVKS